MHNPDGALRVLVTKDLPGTRWTDILTKAGCRVEVCTSEQTILDNATIKTLIGDKCDGVIGQLTEVCVQWERGWGEWPCLSLSLAAVTSCCSKEGDRAQTASSRKSRSGRCVLPRQSVCSNSCRAQDWGAELFEALRTAGGRAYSNYAVGFNNVVVPEATARGIPVGNTPGGHGPPRALGCLPEAARRHTALAVTNVTKRCVGWAVSSAFYAVLCAPCTCPAAGVLTETTAELALALTFSAARQARPAPL